MSVDITQKTYRVVVELLRQNFNTEKYNELNPKPSHSIGENLPVEQISYDEVSLWTAGLNELSKLDNVKVQTALEILLPGHKQGHQYGRPTEAQWEYVSRLGGLAESDYSHGKGTLDLNQYAVYRQKSDSRTKPVGIMKPVFYNGKPLYDLHGNVYKWIEDWYCKNLTGGLDPLATAGVNRVVRGGSWWTNNAEWHMRSGFRTDYLPIFHRFDIGFRLVRSIQ
jgi:formylglycine-generating enzyme required for sulfatase activity